MIIKNIIFDVYGTLISTGTGSVDATRKIFEKYNLDEDEKDIYKKWKSIHKKNVREIKNFISEKQIFTKDLEELFDIYGIKDNPEIEIKPMIDSMYDRKLFEETESAVDKLSEKYSIAIGSTTDTEPLLQNIKNTSLSKISDIYTSENLGYYKPDQNFYKEILNRTNWKPEECVFVGDSLDDDIIGPINAGMSAILIDRKDRYDRWPEGVDKIHSLMEIDNVLN